MENNLIYAALTQLHEGVQKANEHFEKIGSETRASMPKEITITTGNTKLTIGLGGVDKKNRNHPKEDL